MSVGRSGAAIRERWLTLEQEMREKFVGRYVSFSARVLATGRSTSHHKNGLPRVGMSSWYVDSLQSKLARLSHSRSRIDEAETAPRLRRCFRLNPVEQQAENDENGESGQNGPPYRRIHRRVRNSGRPAQQLRRAPDLLRQCREPDSLVHSC